MKLGYKVVRHQESHQNCSNPEKAPNEANDNKKDKFIKKKKKNMSKNPFFKPENKSGSQ